MIKPFFAGKFYPESFAELEESLEESFEGKLGPGDSPMKRKDLSIKGVLVPHSGYQFSGYCAAWAYKLIGERRFAKTYVIIALDHYGKFSKISTTLKDFETVFGVVKINKEFAQHLIDSGLVDNVDDVKEHSLEVQLPFLQYSCKDRVNDLQVLPLIVPDVESVKEIVGLIVGYSKDIVVIVSSDMTHFGEDFNYVPFKFSVMKSVKEQDMMALDFISKLDSNGFLKFVNNKGITICGKNTIFFGIELFKLLDVSKIELLSYYNSSDLVKNEKNFVCYASMVFV